MLPNTYYDMLRLSPDASMDQIREAYRVRSKMFHPDRFDPNKQPAEWHLANEMIKELNSAYQTLHDPIKRAAYDSSLKGDSSHISNDSKRDSTTRNSARRFSWVKLGVITAACFIALLYILQQSPNQISGTIRDVVQYNDHVVFYLSKNRPTVGVAIPRSEFQDEIVIGMLRNDTRGAMAAMLTQGERYLGEKIKVKGVKIKQSDGSSLIFVNSLREIQFSDW